MTGVQTCALPISENSSKTLYEDVDEEFMNLCRETLGIPAIKAGDNFFSAGGDSIKAIKLVAEIRKKYECEIGLDYILNYPVFGELYRIVLGAYKRREETKEPEPAADNINSGRFPLSYSQKGIWYDQVSGETDPETYVIVFDLEINGIPDIDRMEKAVGAAINHFAPMRTVIKLDENFRPYQEMGPEADFHLDYDDISAEPDHDRLLDMYRESFEKSSGMFDFEKGLLYRFALIKAGEDDYRLFGAMHHIICDDISVKLFIDYVSNCYHNNICAEKEEREFFSYCAREEDKCRRIVKKLDLDISEIKLPEFKTKGGSIRQEDYTAVIDGRLLERITDFCAENKLTENMFLLAVYARLLGERSGEKIVPVGMPISKRETYAEDSFGMYINSSLGLVDCGGSFTDTLDSARKNIINLVGEENVPFYVLAEYFKLSHEMKRAPFRFTFNFITAPEAVSDEKSIFRSFKYFDDSVMVDFRLLAEKNADCINCRFTYSNHYVNRDFLVSFAEDFLKEVKAAGGYEGSAEAGERKLRQGTSDQGTGTDVKPAVRTDRENGIRAGVSAPGARTNGNRNMVKKRVKKVWASVKFVDRKSVV